ncbi:MAG: c-type cytochrome [Fuerstiella sp.]|nr:c-type cytochrome [Fuerstiella sp.]
MLKAVSSPLLVILCLFAGRPLILAGESTASDGAEVPSAYADRSPVDLALSPDGQWLVTVNETSDSVTLIRTKDQVVVDEVLCGRHPADIEFCPDGQTVLVSGLWSGDITILKLVNGSLKRIGVIDVGFEPCGLAISPEGDRAYVGLVATGQVAELDLKQPSVLRRFDVGHWPRYLTLSADGSRLAVGCGGAGRIDVIDPVTGETLYDETLANGINLGHMIPSADGTYAYFTWMVYRTNPINVGNLRKGWLLASRIGRVRLDGSSYREAISLDVPGMAVADPHGIVISRDESRLVASAAGTHELLVYRLRDLPFVGVGGPGDLIDRRLRNDPDRFHRIEVGGRPMGLRMADDSGTVYVANYLRNSVQVVDLDSREVSAEIDLGGPTDTTLARRGMEIFHDGRRSLDQWYSCHSCHQFNGINCRPMDTMNDGTEMTLKTVLPLFDVSKTGPWTWHGWQNDLENAMHKSMTSTMLGRDPSDRDVSALLAYLDTLEAPPNPFRNSDGSLNAAARRGQQVFSSTKAGCANCHNGPQFTDGKIHDVGLGSDKDYYEGYNTPSLRGVYRKVRLLHTGRARSLERVVSDLHSPEVVTGQGRLTGQESADLIEYLKSL